MNVPACMCEHVCVRVLLCVCVCVCVQDEVEDTVKKLQVENIRLETELRHEREQTEMLRAELADSQKVGCYIF